MVYNCKITRSLKLWLNVNIKKKAPGNRIVRAAGDSSKISEFCRKKHVCVLTVKGKWFHHILRVLRFGPYLHIYMRYEGPMPARLVPIDIPLQVSLREVMPLPKMEKSRTCMPRRKMEDGTYQPRPLYKGIPVKQHRTFNLFENPKSVA